MCAAAGTIGGVITNSIGGWDNSLATLVIFMTIDYLSGLAVAGLFKKSKKTDNGALQSDIGFKGLCKKGMMLLFVLIANRVDLALQTGYVRDVVVIGFVANELISITENAGLMGIPIPAVITRAIDILKSKESEEEKE